MIAVSPQLQQFPGSCFVGHLLHGGDIVGFPLCRSGRVLPQVEALDQLGKFKPQEQGIGVLAGGLYSVVLRGKVQRRVGDNGGQPIGMAGGLLPRS